jgi:Flp pilus assembly protein protease CpaA
MPCFPSPLPTALGWGFLIVLFGMLTAAAYADLRWVVVPKKLSLTILASGIFANLVRGIVIGSLEQRVWVLPSGPFLGAMDGLLFSLAGLFGGLLIFLPLFGMGIVGGGDAKLFAAMAAWTGIHAALWILGVSAVTMLLLMSVRYLLVIANLGPSALRDVRRRPDNPELKPVPFKRFGAYSPALLLAALIVLPWLCRVHLGLRSSDTVSTAQNAHTAIHRLPAGDSRGP